MTEWEEKVSPPFSSTLGTSDNAVRVKCLPTDTVGDLKRLIAAQTGTTAQKIQLKKWWVKRLGLVISTDPQGTRRSRITFPCVTTRSTMGWLVFHSPLRPLGS
jgi:hypothetical protein